VVHAVLREMGMKQAARVMLSAFMLVKMRTRSLYERHEQGQNDAENGQSKTH
jgi:chromatin segregation and condensation protein Rec8/ScpA/Scc1 (kleisin family)